MKIGSETAWIAGRMEGLAERSVVPRVRAMFQYSAIHEPAWMKFVTIQIPNGDVLTRYSQPQTSAPRAHVEVTSSFGRRAQKMMKLFSLLLIGKENAPLLQMIEVSGECNVLYGPQSLVKLGRRHTERASP